MWIHTLLRHYVIPVERGLACCSCCFKRYFRLAYFYYFCCCFFRICLPQFVVVATPFLARLAPGHGSVVILTLCVCVCPVLWAHLARGVRKWSGNDITPFSYWTSCVFLNFWAQLLNGLRVWKLPSDDRQQILSNLSLGENYKIITIPFN